MKYLPVYMLILLVVFLLLIVISSYVSESYTDHITTCTVDYALPILNSSCKWTDEYDNEYIYECFAARWNVSQPKLKKHCVLNSIIIDGEYKESTGINATQNSENDAIEDMEFYSPGSEIICPYKCETLAHAIRNISIAFTIIISCFTIACYCGVRKNII